MACGLTLVACAFNPEAWRLQLFAINPDPGAMARPAIAHDL